MLLLCYIGGALNRGVLSQGEDELVAQVRAPTYAWVGGCGGGMAVVCARRAGQCGTAILRDCAVWQGRQKLSPFTYSLS